MVEITGYKFNKVQQELTYYYVDLDIIDEWITRSRHLLPMEREMVYDLKNSKHVYYLRKALKAIASKAGLNPETWGEAIGVPVGRIIELNKYKRL